MFCRPCGREHHGPECPVDELGRPSPAPGLVRAVPMNTAPSSPWLVGTFTSGTAAYGGNIVITYGTAQRPPDDDGLAGVPALVRR